MVDDELVSISRTFCEFFNFVLQDRTQTQVWKTAILGSVMSF